MSDLFPGKEIPDHDYGKLQSTIEECMVAAKLQVSGEESYCQYKRRKKFLFVFDSSYTKDEAAHYIVNAVYFSPSFRQCSFYGFLLFQAALTSEKLNKDT